MTITQRVQAILSASKAARNSDKELWLIYAQKSGVSLSDVQMEKIRNMPEFETLRRVRQKLQQVGSFPADETVKASRDYKATQTRQRIPFMGPENVAGQLETPKHNDSFELPDGTIVLPFGQ